MCPGWRCMFGTTRLVVKHPVIQLIVLCTHAPIPGTYHPCTHTVYSSVCMRTCIHPLKPGKTVRAKTLFEECWKFRSTLPTIHGLPSGHSSSSKNNGHPRSTQTSFGPWHTRYASYMLQYMQSAGACLISYICFHRGPLWIGTTGRVTIVRLCQCLATYDGGASAGGDDGVETILLRKMKYRERYIYLVQRTRYSGIYCSTPRAARKSPWKNKMRHQVSVAVRVPEGCISSWYNTWHWTSYFVSYNTAVSKQ